MKTRIWSIHPPTISTVLTPTEQPAARPILRPGDIYWVEIHPAETRGSELFKTRPYVIVSKYGINKVVKSVVGVPLSLGALASQATGWRIFIPKEEILGSSEPKDCVARCDAVRQLDVDERIRGKYGTLSATALTSSGGGLAYLLDLR
jgi:mRNA-degrading endonuclease toxin of MazEF toxin-antitoxin module